MITDLIVPLVTVGLAELGDKTQLSILLLSSRTKNHMQLLLGVMLAFLIVDGAAVLIGSSVARIVPMAALKVASGIAFVLFGLLMLRQKGESAEGKMYSDNSFFSGFVLVLLPEWGDKTQIAAGLFATEYNAFMVLAGTLIALTLLSIIAIYLGKYIMNRIDKTMMIRFAGIAFIVLGLYSLLS